MAIDRKYGQVRLEHGSVNESEPVVVMRAQDKLLPQVLEHYRQLCQDAGSPPRHLDLIDTTRADVEAWQAVNFTKVPDSESSREWMTG